MLAVQQPPRMASDRTPPDDPFLPFGYSVDPTQEPPMDPPPEPPSGTPLLTDSDSKFLSSFFDDITADQYSMPSFGEGLNFSDAWLDLPPTFIGTTTSFGQQAGAPLAQSSAQGMSNDSMNMSGQLPGQHMMPPPPPPHLQQHQQQQHHQHAQQQHNQQQQIHHYQQQTHQHPLQQQQQQHMNSHHHSDDVLNAAATLLHNNQSPRGTPQGHNDVNVPRRAIGPPVGHLRHQPMEEFQEEGRRGSAPVPHDRAYADWMYPPQGRQPESERASVSTDFQWGSDANFGGHQGYTPDANRETVESMHREQLKLLESLEVSKSAASTRPSSPSNAHAQSSNHQRQPASIPKGPEDHDAPPRKRRKSKANAGGEEPDDGDQTTPAKPARRRKSKVDRAESSPIDDGSGGKKKRGAAAVNGSKQQRENLTEEQKRENHIKSEQKRRTLIKEGFDDLCELVPALRGGGFSKSTMLTITAEWLEDFLRGNDALLEQLASLEGSG